MKVIITGTTGMVGEGVLHECLQHNAVEKVLAISRKPNGISHPKLTEIIHADFYDISPLENQLQGYDACFFCLGVTSVGKKEPEYFKLTYTLTLNFAKTLCQLNTAMTFCYVSGAGTDSTEKGKSMWARVKGKTENDLLKLPFKSVYNFRPGLIKPTKGLKNTLGVYKYLGWLYPILKTLFPNTASTLKEVGLAMITVADKGFEKNIVEVKDIIALAKK